MDRAKFSFQPIAIPRPFHRRLRPLRPRILGRLRTSSNSPQSCKLIEEPQSQFFSIRFLPWQVPDNLYEKFRMIRFRLPPRAAADQHIQRVSRNIRTRENKHYGEDCQDRRP